MSECTHVLQAAGRAYPRTCAICKLGPCQRYADAQRDAAGVTPVSKPDAAEPTKGRVERAIEEFLRMHEGESKQQVRPFYETMFSARSVVTHAKETGNRALIATVQLAAEDAIDFFLAALERAKRS